MPDGDPGFAQRTVVVLGSGSIARLPGECRRLEMRRPAILIDPGLVAGPVAQRIGALLPDAPVIANQPGEPTFDSVAAAARSLEAAQVDGVVAVGGGSTIDTAKVARGLIAARVDSPKDLPEEIPQLVMPLIAVPTTAGTGAELGADAVVTDPDVADKVIIGRAALAADVAIADGDLTLSLPPSLTAYTGCDALAQAIFAYVPAGWDSVAGQLALRAMRIIFDALPRAVADGSDRDARRDLMLGSVLSAMAMFNAPPTYVGEHDLVELLGVALGVHHGHLVAALLPGVAEFNVEILEEPYAEIARELGFVEESASTRRAAAALVEALRRLVEDVGIPPLRAVVTVFPVDELVRRCERRGRLAQNPRPMRRQDAVAILAGAYDGSFRVHAAS